MRIFPDSETLARTLADDVAAALRTTLELRAIALLAVSGGNTPGLFFAALSKSKLDWSRVVITLVDERWVPETSPRSNAALVRRSLLVNEAASARFIPLYNGAATPDAGLSALEVAFADLPLAPAVAILGMGEDGHTASFFPGGDHLAAALNAPEGQKLATMRVPGGEEPRITFTLPVLAAADFLAVHIEGERKRDVLARAQQPGPDEAMPIRALLRHNPQIFWSP